MPNCDEVVTPRQVSTTIPDTVPVVMTWCRSCDVRQCGFEASAGDKCDAKVHDPYVKRCPRGHYL
jgi:hypothetical protein